MHWEIVLYKTYFGESIESEVHIKQSILIELSIRLVDLFKIIIN